MFLYTIPNLSIVFLIISFILAVGTPIVLPIIIRRKTKQSWKVYFIGAAIWIVFALILEGIINNRVTALTNIQSNILVYATYGGLMAGIFEETGRFIAFKYILKKNTRKETALMYAAGHGGIESIILVGISLAVSIFMAIMINSGNLASIITDPTKLQTTLDQYEGLSTASSGIFLLGGFERVLAIAIHFAFSIIVFKAVKEHQIKYFLLAIGLHALTDFGALLITHYIPVGQYEIILLIETIILAWFAIKIYRNIKVDQKAEYIES